MKKMLKLLALGTVMTMMAAGMQMTAFAADESSQVTDPAVTTSDNTEVTPQNRAETTANDDVAPQDQTPANPTTGMAGNIGAAGAAALSALVAGSAALAFKKKQ